MVKILNLYLDALVPIAVGSHTKIRFIGPLNEKEGK